MRIEALREFLTLSQTLSYRQAANLLFMSVPTLSKHMQALEAELGVALFSRDSRSVTLTEDGQRILEAAREVLDGYDRLLALAHQERPAPLRIATPLKYTVFSDLLARVIPEAAQIIPGFSHRVVDTGVTAANDKLPEDADVIILEALPERPMKKDGCLPLFTKRAGVWLPASNPLAEAEKISLFELQGMTYRSVEGPDAAWTRAVVSKLREHGFEPELGSPVDDLYLLGGNDYAIVYGGEPSSAMGPGMVKVPLAEPVEFTVAAFYDRKTATPALRAFLKVLERVAKDSE